MIFREVAVQNPEALPITTVFVHSDQETRKITSGISIGYIPEFIDKLSLSEQVEKVSQLIGADLARSVILYAAILKAIDIKTMNMKGIRKIRGYEMMPSELFKFAINQQGYHLDTAKIPYPYAWYDPRHITGGEHEQLGKVALLRENDVVRLSDVEFRDIYRVAKRLLKEQEQLKPRRGKQTLSKEQVDILKRLTLDRDTFLREAITYPEELDTMPEEEKDQIIQNRQRQVIATFVQIREFMTHHVPDVVETKFQTKGIPDDWETVKQEMIKEESTKQNIGKMIMQNYLDSAKGR